MRGSHLFDWGEALLGGPVKQDIVQFLVIEANIMPRG